MQEARAEPRVRRLEIYTTGGFAMQVADSFEETMAILDGSAVGSDEYIYFRGDDGLRSACRKRDIIGIAEYVE